MALYQRDLLKIMEDHFEEVSTCNMNISKLCKVVGISREYFYRAWRNPEILNIFTAQKIINGIHWYKKNPKT